MGRASRRPDARSLVITGKAAAADDVAVLPGSPVRHPTNTPRAFASLPIRLHPLGR